MDKFHSFHKVNSFNKVNSCRYCRQVVFAISCDNYVTTWLTCFSQVSKDSLQEALWKTFLSCYKSCSVFFTFKGEWVRLIRVAWVTCLSCSLSQGCLLQERASRWLSFSTPALPRWPPTTKPSRSPWTVLGSPAPRPVSSFS